MLMASQVTAPVMSSFDSKPEGSQVPVSITPFGNKLKLHTQDGNKYAGILSVPELSTVMRQFSANLDATLLTPRDRPTELPGLDPKKKLKLHFPRECSLRIVISGIGSEGDALANVLSEAGLYLQHPSPNDVDRGLTYFNPHYLLRPGGRMPKLIESTTSDTKLKPRADVSGQLDEAKKSRFMQLFDEANDGQSRPLTTSSPRLRATLEQ